MEEQWITTEVCVVEGVDLMIFEDTTIYLDSGAGELVGQKINTLTEGCYFDLLLGSDRYCVAETGEVHGDQGQQLGSCEACTGDDCYAVAIE